MSPLFHPTQASNPLQPPIVIDLRKRKVRKRRYSQELRDIQVLERDMTRITHRMVRALDKGLAEYRQARDRSARKNRDGALRDALPNLGKGMATTLREASPLVEETARALDNRTTRRILREQISLTSRTLRTLLR